MKLLSSIFLSFILAFTCFSAETNSLVAVEPPPIPQSPVYSITNKVEGLELPEPITVDSSEGFLVVQAKSKGTVKWFVVGNSKVKYVSNDAGNSLIVSVPQSGSVNVFAIALVDGKLTDFARTDITVKGVKPDPVKPDPTDPVDPDVVIEKVPEGLHVTFLTDYNESTPDIAAVLNSKDIRDIILKTKSFYKVYDVNSLVVKQKKMDTLLKKLSSNNLFVVQKTDGTVLYYSSIPKTEVEVIKVLNKITKGE